MKELFSELNLEASMEKDVAPTYELLCLGVLVNFLIILLSSQKNQMCGYR